MFLGGCAAEFRKEIWVDTPVIDRWSYWPHLWNSNVALKPATPTHEGRGKKHAQILFSSHSRQCAGLQILSLQLSPCVTPQIEFRAICIQAYAAASIKARPHVGLRTAGPVVFFYLCVCRGPAMVQGRVNSKVFVKASIPQGSWARHRYSSRVKDDVMTSESTRDLHPSASLSHSHIFRFYKGENRLEL